MNTTVITRRKLLGYLGLAAATPAVKIASSLPQSSISEHTLPDRLRNLPSPTKKFYAWTPESEKTRLEVVARLKKLRSKT